MWSVLCALLLARWHWTLTVLTDGVVEQEGCQRLAARAARRHCRAGARSMNEALVTFS
jgi:hypothetical protein